MKKEPRTILYITLSNLGDALLAMPALFRLRGLYPHSAIDVMASDFSRGLFTCVPWIREVLPYPGAKGFKEKLCAVRAMRARRYERIVDLKKSYLGLFLRGNGSLKSYMVPRDKMHRFEYHLWRAGFCDGFRKGEVALEPPQEARQAVEVFFGDYPADARFIGIAAGSKSHTKRWHAGGFAALADALVKKGYVPVFLGSAEDRAAQDAILKIMTHSRDHAIDLVGKTDIAGLVAAFDRLSMVVSNDSALVHLASIKNIPTVALFGPTDPRKYGPRADDSAVLRLRFECMPCEKALCYKNPPESVCMRALPAHDILEKVFEILGKIAR